MGTVKILPLRTLLVKNILRTKHFEHKSKEKNTMAFGFFIEGQIRAQRLISDQAKTLVHSKWF
jgi:hypothetical protein